MLVRISSLTLLFLLYGISVTCSYHISSKIVGSIKLNKICNNNNQYHKRGATRLLTTQIKQEKLSEPSFFYKLLNSLMGKKLEAKVNEILLINNDCTVENVDEIISKMPRKKMLIIGAGMSGLSCANELMNYNFTDFIILESTDGPGGRVKSDKIEGYLLDRGFQVFIDSYPEALNLFNSDYGDLELKSFLPGALVRYK